MNWWKTAAQPRFHVERNGLEFKAFLGNEHIGQAFLVHLRGREYMLSAIDIFDHSEDGGPNYQRKGYGTLLMKSVRQYLRAAGAELLHSSNEGSGTVQLLDRTFGRKNVEHTDGSKVIDYETAKRIMDVNYGRTGSKVYVQPRNKKQAMATRSGFPELDKAIQDFMRSHEGLEHMRDKQNAWGQCEEIADACAAFLKQRGFTAYSCCDELKRFPGYEKAKDSKAIGAGDFSYPEHCVVEVYKLPGMGVLTVTIDFTASQYGFTEFPKVHPGPRS